MEQSVNTFSKGLQLDTSPMVLGNDTLSDALNATFVTMNGNEVILQNDMGNRKVDNAYLPNGYEPVGIKEYGGIIYIAAYNPITNRSLIGSFPSPERRISLADDENLGGTLNLGIGNNFIFKEEIDSNLGGLHVLKNDTALISLTKDTSLHAGDKFIVYNVNSNYTDNFNTGLSNGEIITNYDNTILGKIRSPKNKQYTLSLGILNSQNEFVDITSSLVRWNTGNNGSLVDTSNMTELLKFNSGYFIRRLGYSGYFNDKRDEYPIADGELLKERENAYLVMEANTYAYKLIGPLYLLTKLNHILGFSYNIYGTYNNGELELYIEGYITYNCPDGGTLNLNDNDTDTGDDNYSSYNEYIPTFAAFDFWYKDSNDNYILYDNYNGGEDIKKSYSKYDPITNLYSTKITKHLILDSDYILLNSDSVVNYIIGVRAINNQVGGNYIYLSGLSDKGIIDVSKLGSGEISLKGWRFHNNYEKKKGTITLNLEAYPKYGETFGNLTIEFKNVLNDQGNWENTITHPIPVKNGKTNIDVDWSPLEDIPGNNFLSRALYNVTIKYGNTTISDTEFYLTTELFNECYIPGNPKFVVDFGDTTNVHILEKLNIKYDVEYEVLDESKLLDPEIDSQIFVPKASNNVNQRNPYIVYTNKYMLNFYIKGSVKFNKELYPSYIVPISDLKIKSGSPISYNNFDIDSNITYNIGNNFDPNGDFDITLDNNNNILYTKSNMSDGRIRIFKSEFIYEDKFTANAINKILNDIYVPIDDTVIEHFISDNMTCCGVTLDWGKDKHYLRSTVIDMVHTVLQSGRSPYNRNTGHLGALPEQVTFKDETHDGTQNFWFYESLIGNLVLNDFTARSTKNTIFTWLFGFDDNKPPYNEVGIDNYGYDSALYNASNDSTFRSSYYAIGEKNNSISTSTYDYRVRNAGKRSRLWWRTSDNSWALVNFILTYPGEITNPGLEYALDIKEQIAKLFKNSIGQYDLYFCHYKQTSSDSDEFGHKLGPDIENYKYNYPYTINLGFSLNNISSAQPELPDAVFLTKFIYLNNGTLINSINPNGSMLKFKADPITGGTISYNITINSSSVFLDYVNTVLSSTISNISDFGTTKDIDKNPLLPNRIYRKNLYGLLELLPNINIYVDEDYSSRYRSILYKGYTYSTASDRYDICSAGDGGTNITILDFTRLNIVENIQ